MEQRPRVTDEMVKTAIAKLLQRYQFENGNAEELFEVYFRGANGFELAKALEEDHNWTIGTPDVIRLDNLDFMVEEEHEVACKKWAQENNIAPPLPVGTQIKEGVITGVSNHRTATYEVKLQDAVDTPQCSVRRYVNFEHAVAVAA